MQRNPWAVIDFSRQPPNMVKRLEIDRDAFHRIVTDLECKQTFSNPTAIWAAVVNTEGATV
ncbi:MAG: hypothetical protein ACLQNE_07050 [Thermoguttaceae bacterium]